MRRWPLWRRYSDDPYRAVSELLAAEGSASEVELLAEEHGVDASLRDEALEGMAATAC